MTPAPLQELKSMLSCHADADALEDLLFGRLYRLIDESCYGVSEKHRYYEIAHSTDMEARWELLSRLLNEREDEVIKTP